MRRYPTVTEFLTELMKATAGSGAPIASDAKPTPAKRAAPPPTPAPMLEPSLSPEAIAVASASLPQPTAKRSVPRWLLPVAGLLVGVAAGVWVMVTILPPLMSKGPASANPGLTATASPLGGTSNILPPQETATALAPQLTATPGLPSTQAAAQPQARIKVSSAAMYEGPGTLYYKVGPREYSLGEIVTILERDRGLNGEWFRVLAADGETGWLYFEWISEVRAWPSVPTAQWIPSPPPTPTKPGKEGKPSYP